jgi:glycosyltransferase involved in cell wall biosynthesis
MFASVIFTTYNHPQWLVKTLWGFSAQSYRDFEIIVADDGSDQETRDVVESIQAQIDVPIQRSIACAQRRQTSSRRLV